MLGHCYASGNGVPEDMEEARKWYLKAADKGCTEAQTYLGIMHLDDYSLTSRLKAIHWLRKAVRKQNGEAYLTLGDIYSGMYGGRANERKSAKYYVLAAEAGSYFAQYIMGMRFQEGDIVEYDPERAFRYFSMAADQGYPEALAEVAVCYMGGYWC